jgi:hypothetical protein
MSTQVIENVTAEILAQGIEAVRKGEITAEVMIAEAKPCD